MPITMGGMASGVDTDAVIKKLVEAESQPIKQLQRDKVRNNQKKDALRKLSGQLKDLDAKARELYGFRATYDEKKALSSDTSVLDATASKLAEPGSKKVEVSQLASSHRIASDSFDSAKSFSAGKITVTVNGEDKSVNFKGGKLKTLNDLITETASDIVAVEYVNTSDGNYMIVLSSRTTGKKGEIRLGGSDDLLRETGFIKGEKIKNMDESAVVFDRKFFSTYNGEKRQDDQDGSVDVGRDGRDARVTGRLWQEYELPLKMDIKKDTTFRFSFDYKKEVEESIPLRIETGPEDEINVKGIKLRSYNVSRMRQLPKKKESRADSVIGIGMIATDGGKRIEKLYPIEADASKGQEIPVGRDFDGKQITRLVLYCNSGETKFIDPVFSTPIKSKGEFEFKNIIAEAGNAKLKVDGIPIERDKNEGLNDVIKGLTMNIKRKSENPVEVKVTADIDKPVLKIKEFVDSYNNYLDLHRALTRSVKVEKPGETEKLNESGLFMGDMALISLENNLKTTVSSSYPSREDIPIRMFNQMGVSTGKVNSNWDAIKAGKLVIDDEMLRNAIINNPAGVRSFFGSDNDGDNRIDNGMAYVLTRNLAPYITFGKNIIDSKIQFEDNSIKTTDEKIARHESHLKQFEDKLRKKFAFMEKSISGAKSQRNWMNNQMNEKNNNEK